ncbi:TPA: ImmA/IrrE family metallo-endopeptidase [Streptococcus pyogenes]|uniref:Phage protein n=3 Tax=Streptococcus TaxID=1301 RepID=A0A8B6J560_STRPY|nr:ImmA/IrrE family metallo-endopeptidase [Streptococcus pyogenes]VHD18182.1 phage protein [Streptococcus pyogenes]HER5751868.1 ImmA/IrrE family metallo-endopeptidase [Streptococcus pyogenes]
MTLQELCDEYCVELCLFDGSGWHSKGFYNPATNVLCIDVNLPDHERYQVALHELGHIKHLPHLYPVFREKYELQSNRNMIHHLLKAELDECQDKNNFNYLVFMKKYKLKTMADESMVKEEYYNLFKII